MWSVLLAGMVLIATALILRARKAHQNLTPREQLERMKQQRGVRGDLKEIMAEVEQLARRFSAQLDAKTHHLERLIDEADQRIERLERARPAKHRRPTQTIGGIRNPTRTTRLN